MNKVFDIIVRVVFYVMLALQLIVRFFPQSVLAPYRDGMVLVAFIALIIMKYIDAEV